MISPIHNSAPVTPSLAQDLASPVIPPSRRRLLLWIFGPLFLALAVSVFVRSSDLDLRIQAWVYEQGGQSWALGEHPFWKAIYRFGVFPAVIVVLAALVVHGVSQVRRSLRPLRLLCWFWILTTALGPGVIANGLLKEYWGRPRPRELVEFGGHRQFEPVLSYDASSGGKSFPSGHATMGFVLMGGYLLLYRQRQRLAWAVLMTGGVGGGLLGFARIAQGGHFFSDVVWAAAVCWWSSLAVFYCLGLHRKPLVAPVSEDDRAQSWRQRLGIGAASIALVTAVLLGTPYREKRDYFLTKADASEKPLVLTLRFALGEIELVAAEKFRIVGEAYGHGVPTSGIKAKFVERVQEEQVVVSYGERHSGWLAEAKQQLRVEIPWSRVTRVEVESGTADLWISLPEGVEGKVIELRSGSGAVEIKGSTSGVTVVRGEHFHGELTSE